MSRSRTVPTDSEDFMLKLYFMQEVENVNIDLLSKDQLDVLYWEEWNDQTGFALSYGEFLGFYAKVVAKAGQAIYEGAAKANFGSVKKLEQHFAKHSDEFKGIYNNADEYLQGARDVMQNGTKVSYTYKGETRTGFLRFMGNNSKGVAKFEFVGTNNAGEITTYHVESGKTFWKMLNGENVQIINPLD